jgi:hypothetical protein
MTTSSVAVARSPISVITSHLMRRHTNVQDSRRTCTHAKRMCMYRTMTGMRDSMSLTTTRSRIHSLINGDYEGGTPHHRRGSRRNYSILASDISEYLHTQCTMPGCHTHCTISLPLKRTISLLYTCGQNGFNATGKLIPTTWPESLNIAPFSSRATISRGTAIAVPFKV